MEVQFNTFNSLAMTHRNLTSDLKRIGNLTSASYRILLKIGESEDGIRITEISDALNFKFTSVSAIVEALVKRGIVKREEDISDKRAFRLTATKHGKDLILEIDKTILDKLKTLWAPLSKQQLKIILINLDEDHLSSNYVESIETPYLLAEAKLKTLNLTYTQFLILLSLETQGCQRPRDIALGLDQKPATISVALQHLEKKKLIERSRSSEDRSSTNTTITPEGKKTVDAAVASIKLSHKKLTYRYTEKEQSELDIISKLVAGTSTRPSLSEL